MDRVWMEAPHPSDARMDGWMDGHTRTNRKWIKSIYSRLDMYV